VESTDPYVTGTDGVECPTGRASPARHKGDPDDDGKPCVEAWVFHGEPQAIRINPSRRLRFLAFLNIENGTVAHTGEAPPVLPEDGDHRRLWPGCAGLVVYAGRQIDIENYKFADINMCQLRRLNVEEVERMITAETPGFQEVAPPQRVRGLQREFCYCVSDDWKVFVTSQQMVGGGFTLCFRQERAQLEDDPGKKCFADAGPGL
jgi:hypothetical protein